MPTKQLLDKAITVGAAVSAPVLAILIRHHVLTAQDATDVGYIVVAAVGSWHGGAAAQKRLTAPPSTPETKVQ